MGNQLIREQIIKILKSHSYHHTEGVGVKSQFKYLAEIAFECCADEIMLALDQSQFTADEAEEHINQEVEKRIAERMPSEEEIKTAGQKMFGSLRYEIMERFAFNCGVSWLRSRLTTQVTPQDTHQVQKEGGGE